MAEFANLFQAAPPQPQASTFDTEKLKQIFTEQRHTDWTVGEAFLALMIKAIEADGTVTAEEHAELMALSRRSRALKSYSPEQMAHINNVVAQRFNERPNALEEACQSLPTDMRLTIFAHCMDLILTDGQLLPVEAEFLNKITTYLGLDLKEAERIQQVLYIKNRF